MATLDPEELRANLRQADAGVLVAVLAQLTGDPRVVDRFGPKISHIPDPPNVPASLIRLLLKRWSMR